MTTADALLASLRASGIDVQPLGLDRLKVEAPEGALTEEMRAMIRQHKTEMIRTLTTMQFSGGPHDAVPESSAPAFTAEALADFARSESRVEIRVPGFGETIWFASDVAHLGALLEEGVTRGRIWLPAELADMLSIPNRTPEVWCAAIVAKVLFDGVVEVRPR